MSILCIFPPTFNVVHFMISLFLMYHWNRMSHKALTLTMAVLPPVANQAQNIALGLAVTGADRKSSYVHYWSAVEHEISLVFHISPMKHLPECSDSVPRDRVAQRGLCHDRHHWQAHGCSTQATICHAGRKLSSSSILHSLLLLSLNAVDLRGCFPCDLIPY